MKNGETFLKRFVRDKVVLSREGRIKDCLKTWSKLFAPKKGELIYLFDDENEFG
jgi:hypothetical protein